jgi:transcriptional regulator with XRE-family HTH domain
MYVKHIFGGILSVGNAIFAIRKRMKKTMVEFGRIIGANHGTVSRYESEKVPPSNSMLILLLLLAEGEEKEPLLKALGIGDDAEIQGAYQHALNSLLEYGRRAGRSQSKSTKEAGLRKFVEEAAAIATSGISLDLAVAEVLRRLRTPKASRQIQAHFRTFLACLDVAGPEPKRITRTKGRNKLVAKSNVR